MINRPGDLYESYKKQSVDSRDYDTFMAEYDNSRREFDKLEGMEL
jgi:hypothetical protein